MPLRAGKIVWNIDALGIPDWETQGEYERMPQ